MGSRDSSELNFTRKRDRLSPDSESDAPKSPNSSEIGTLGENFVADWLQQQGWEILHRQWYCRWGEIDIIALGTDADIEINRGNKNSQFPIPNSPILAFVEVKTRRRGNWDADGMLAVSAAKQAKLWQTAEIFLSTRPDLVDRACRFDVALVRCESARPNTQKILLSTAQNSQVALGGNYCLTLQQYIRSAFSN